MSPESCISPDSRARPGTPKDAIKHVLHSIRATSYGLLSIHFLQPHCKPAPIPMLMSMQANKTGPRRAQAGQFNVHYRHSHWFCKGWLLMGCFPCDFAELGLEGINSRTQPRLPLMSHQNLIASLESKTFESENCNQFLKASFPFDLCGIRLNPRVLLED